MMYITFRKTVEVTALIAGLNELPQGTVNWYRVGDDDVDQIAASPEFVSAATSFLEKLGCEILSTRARSFELPSVDRILGSGCEHYEIVVPSWRSYRLVWPMRKWISLRSSAHPDSPFSTQWLARMVPERVNDLPAPGKPSRRHRRLFHNIRHQKRSIRRQKRKSVRVAPFVAV